MDDLQVRVENFIAHYASEYYDPAKAREYYLRTRELKGRQSSAGLKTEAKKGAFEYAKNQIGEAKKQALYEASEGRKAVVEQARQAAAEHRKAISEKLSLLFKAISEKRQEESEKLSDEQSGLSRELAAIQKREAKRISDEASRKIAALPPIPKGISEKRYAELVAKRSEQIAKIRGQADKDKQAMLDSAITQRQALSRELKGKRKTLSDQANQEKAAERETADQERDVVAQGLKSAIDKARTDYEALKENLKAKYEKATQDEYEAIKTNV